MDPDTLNILLLVGMIIICLLVVFVISWYEAKRGKPVLGGRQKAILEAAEENAGYIKGQVYQMEDGTLAQYGDDGKFYKIKEE